MYRALKQLFVANSKQSNPATTQRGFRPGLENLENRWVPATLVNASGGVLTITGDNLDNDVQIIQDDNTNSLTVIADGQNYNFNSFSITKIKVDLKGGKDTLDYTLPAGADYSSTKSVDVKMGGGEDQVWFDFRGGGIGGDAIVLGSLDITVDTGANHDEVTAHFNQKHGGHLNFTAKTSTGDDNIFVNMWGDISGGADVVFDLQGGSGNDTIGSWNSFDNKAYQYNNIDVTHDSTFSIYMNGQAGNDQLGLTYSGEMDGHLNVVMDGRSDNDTVNADLYRQDSASGQVDVQLFGGTQDDQMYLRIYEDASSHVDIVNALLDGGTNAGDHDVYNWLETTNNVDVVHFEGATPVIILI